MTHKSHPYIKRVPIIKGWKSRWFNLKDYQKNAREDYYIREYILEKFKNAGIADVQIERFSGSLSVIVFTSRPGILIGRGGSGIEEIKKDTERILRKKIKASYSGNTDTAAQEKSFPEIRVEVKEVRETDAHARLLAVSVAEQLERRMPFRRVIKRSLDRITTNKEVQGAKILVKGRLNGAEMARSEFVKHGNLPLQTLRADIDYAHVEAITKYGVIGVKVWIYKGEKLE